MASSTPTTASGKPTSVPTQTEAFLFFYVIKNMKTKPDVDWDAVAADAGFKSGEVAKVRFGQVKRKLGVEGVPKVARPRPGPSVPKSKPPVRRAKGSGPTGVIKATAGAKKGKGAAASASALTPEAVQAILNNNGQDDDDEVHFALPVAVKTELFDPLAANQAAYADNNNMGMSLEFEPIAQRSAGFANYHQLNRSRFELDFEDDI